MEEVLCRANLLRVGQSVYRRNLLDAVTTPNDVEELAKNSATVRSFSQLRWRKLYNETPPMNHYLVMLMLRRVGEDGGNDAASSAHALALYLLKHLIDMRMEASDAEIAALAARDFLESDAADVDAQRTFAEVLWRLVRRNNRPVADSLVRDSNAAQQQVVQSGAQRVSVWQTDFGDAGYVSEASEKLKAHFMGTFGTPTPPLTCPNRSGPLKLTPPQEVVRYLYDPATGPKRMRFVVVQRPGLGKTLCMLVTFAAHWWDWKTHRPLERPPSFLLLALPAVQDNMKDAIKDFGAALGIDGILPHIVMLDFRYANQVALAKIRSIISQRWGVTCVDEAQDLVDLSLDKQRNAGGASSWRMKDNALAIAGMLRTECHELHALLLATGTALATLDKLVNVVNYQADGTVVTEGSIIECMALRNADVFPRLRPGIGSVPSDLGDAVGEYAPFTKQDVVTVPFAAAPTAKDQANDDLLANLMVNVNIGYADSARRARAKKAPKGNPAQKVRRKGVAAVTAKDQANDNVLAKLMANVNLAEEAGEGAADRGAPTYVEALLQDLEVFPKGDLRKKLPQSKYEEKGNCAASYLGYLVTNYAPDFKDAVKKYPFALVPKLAACAAAAFRMHFASPILGGGTRPVSIQSVDASYGDDVAMVTFECDGTVHTCVRALARAKPSNGSVARAPPNVAIPASQAEWIEVTMEDGTPAYISNLPTKECRPRQLILLDNKHGLKLFASVADAVRQRLYPHEKFDASKIIYELTTPSRTGNKERDQRAREVIVEKMDAAFNKNPQTTFCWLLADASTFSESVDLPGPRTNPIALHHYVSLPVDKEGKGNASKFIQGMLRTARFCKSRNGWMVALLLYTLHEHAATTVQECDDMAVQGLREETDKDFGPGGAFSKFREYAIDRVVMEHINDGVVVREGGSATPAVASVARWFDLDLEMVKRVAEKCASQAGQLLDHPCVDHGANASDDAKERAAASELDAMERRAAELMEVVRKDPGATRETERLAEKAQQAADAQRAKLERLRLESCPSPLCVIEGVECAPRPEGTVCDNLAAELQSFQSWARLLTQGDLETMAQPAMRAVRELMDSGAFAGVDLTDMTRRAAEQNGAPDGALQVSVVRKVAAHAMRLVRMGSYQPYLDASSITEPCERAVTHLVDSAELVVADGRDAARILACAALVRAWAERPEFDFADPNFVSDVLPELVAAVGNRLFALGIERYDTTGAHWYDQDRWYNRLVRRRLAQGKTALGQTGAQLRRNLGSVASDAKKSVRDIARRLVGYDAANGEGDSDVAWASSPHTLFAWLLLQRMMRQ